MKKSILIVIACLTLAVSAAFGADDPLARLSGDTLQFFKPVSGKVLTVEGSRVTAEVNTKEGLKPGARINILREGAAFSHPVTHEILGRVESQAGRLEVKAVQGNRIAGVLVDGTAQAGDKLRRSETKVKTVFIQDKTVDWYLGDDLYRKLKAAGRMEMADTSVETDDAAEAVREARRLKAEVVVVLTAKEADKGTLLRERAFWVSDGAAFYDTEIKIDLAFTKELKLGGDFIGGMMGEALFKYDLPYGARYIVTGDFDGDGKQEIGLSTGSDFRVYLPGVELKPLWEFKGKGADDHIWVDTLDINRDGRDELIITSMRGSEVFSSMYRLEGKEFKLLWEGKLFLRKLGTSLIAQKYTQSDGFDGDVFFVTWDGGKLKNGDTLKLPKGVNIYDFIQIEGPAKEQYIFAYDEKGFMSVFDEKGLRIWKSTVSVGAFSTTFKRKSPASYIQETEWSVKDRLSIRSKEVLAVRKTPFVDMAKGLGTKHSSIRSFWWAGFSMDERSLIDDIPGSILDYALVGDKIVVLSSPFLGIKFGNVLKGENPLGTLMFIYSARGR